MGSDLAMLAGAQHLISGDWKPIEGTDRDLLLFKLMRAASVSEKLSALPAPAGVWAMPLICYPDCLLCEVQAGDGPGDQRLAHSVATFIYGPDGVSAITGDSSVFHDLNESGRLSILGIPSLLEYVRLFSSGTHGEEGRFEILESSEQLEWAEPAQGAARHAIAIVGPKAQLLADGNWRADVTIRYGVSVFSSVMNVDKSGALEMLDDEILASALPLVEEDFVGPFRFVASPGRAKA